MEDLLLFVRGVKPAGRWSERISVGVSFCRPGFGSGSEPGYLGTGARDFDPSPTQLIITGVDSWPCQND